jgi:hypothetical protein
MYTLTAGVHVPLLPEHEAHHDAVIEKETTTNTETRTAAETEIEEGMIKGREPSTQ